MKLALDAPTKVTVAGKSESFLGMIHSFCDFDFISAERIVKDKPYADFYKESNNIKFVDGTPLSKDKPMTIETLKKAVDYVGGTYILNSYEENVKVFGERRAVGVLHGKSLQEILENVSLYRSVTVSVPASLFINENVPLELSAYLRALVVSNIPTDRYVHLSGFLSLVEFYWYTNRLNVVSLNTCVPVMLGLKEEDILEPTTDIKSLRCESDGGELTQKKWGAVSRNIALLRKFMS